MNNLGEPLVNPVMILRDECEHKCGQALFRRVTKNMRPSVCWCLIKLELFYTLETIFTARITTKDLWID